MTVKVVERGAAETAVDLSATETTADVGSGVHCVAMLASVRDADEASLCVTAGVDFIDAKEPLDGVLGAVSPDALRGIRAVVPDDIPLSATIGDNVLAAEKIAAAAQMMADCGADIVKIGLFPGVDVDAMLTALTGHNASDKKIVAVLLADQNADFSILPKLAAAGFYGAMLDTVDKVSSGLTRCLPTPRLKDFVVQAQALGLKAGLAGGLTLPDLPLVLECKPDIVGFRGALVAENDRTARLDMKALQKVRASVPSLI